jgi:ribonuclease D
LNFQPSPTYQYIEAESNLQGLIDRMKRSNRVALDTEADSLHHYFEKVCLIQLSIDGCDYIVDPLSGLDLSLFLQILEEKTLLLHGADYDLRMLHSSFGFRPQGDVFDTMLAAQVLGYEQFSLATLVHRFFDVSLSKKGQKSDWSKRPLSKAQLEYARNDTKYLQALAYRLHGELDRLGRLEWQRETCDTMVRSALQDRPQRDPDKIWRIKGWTKLEQRQLLFLRQLWHWRENEAKNADVPPFKIMNNHSLLDMAIWAASHPVSATDDHPKLRRHIKGRRLLRLKAILRKTHGVTKSSWPERSTRKRSWYDGSDYRSEVGALQAECARAAAELGIASSFLASRATLERIVRQRAGTIDELMTHGPMMRWQAQVLAPRILPLLKTLYIETENHGAQ